MKTRILVFLFSMALIFTVPGAKAQLINPGFEIWNADKLGYLDPNSGNGITGWWDYNLFNFSLIGASPISVTRCDTAHSGNYSARIETVVYSPTSYAYIKPWGDAYFGHSSDTMGVLFNGNMDIVSTTSFSFKGGIPYDHKAILFRYWYQYAPNGTDEAECFISLHRRTVIKGRDTSLTVAAGYWLTSAGTDTTGWHQATVHMTYLDTLTPDTALVIFSASSLNPLLLQPKPGSVLWVDDFSDSIPATVIIPPPIVVTDTNKLHFYNMISPNGDGENDFWTIDNISEFPINHVAIFDRWGTRRWETDNYDNLGHIWKGSDQAGTAMPAGTYFYVLKIPSKQYSGYIELIK